VPAGGDRLLTRRFLHVTAAAFVFFLYVGVLVPIVPTYVEDELRGGELGVGLAIAAFAGAAIAARPLIGRLIDRHGRRTVMAGGAALAALAGSLYGFVDSIPVLLVLRGLTGIGEAALFVGAATLVADLSPGHRRAEAASYFSVALYAGLGIGPIIGEAVIERTSFEVAFLTAAGFAALAAAMSLSLPKGVATAAGGDGDDEAAALPAAEPAPTGLTSRRSAAFVHPVALGPGLVLACGSAAFAVFSAFLPEYSRQLGLSGSGALFAVYSVVCLGVRLLGARLPERLGPRTSGTTTFCVLGAALLLLAGVPHVWALWVAAALVGVAMAFLYPSLMALTVNRAPMPERARAISSFTMFFEIGTAAGALALGAVADVLGKRVGFAGAVLLCAAGLWVMWVKVLPTPGRRPARRAVPLDPAYVPSPVCGD
jgi:MFS family permease